MRKTSTSGNKKHFNWVRIISICFIFSLWLVQVKYSFTSHKIRLEELSESIRNVFWLQNRTIYDGISSNVGWYGTLLIIYNLFGFSLFEAKIFRLVLHGLFLLTLFAILKRFLGEKKAWLPLITISLSPSLLYFNMLQTSFGIDLQYIPICLYLLLNLKFDLTKKDIFKQFCLWSLAMIASLSYPSFIIYLPILLIIYFYFLFKYYKGSINKQFFFNFIISLAGFFTPLIAILIYLKDRSILFYDPHNKSGLFRGGGSVGFPDSLDSLSRNIISGSKQVMSDLFIKADSFYFEVEILRVEFSNKIVMASTIMIILLSILFIIKKAKFRLIIALSWLLILLGFSVNNISNWYPGLRRSTSVLVGFYIIYSLVWYLSNNLDFKKNYYIKIIGMVCCLIVTFHHIKIYPNNLMALQIPSPHAKDACFNRYVDNPEKSFNYYLEQIMKTSIINTLDNKGNVIDCRLHEIYAAIAGACLWNKLNCPRNINGYDEKTKQFIPLSIKLWEDYYFQH